MLLQRAKFLFFLWLSGIVYTPCLLYHIHLLMDTCLAVVKILIHILAIVNNAAMNIEIQASF